MKMSREEIESNINAIKSWLDSVDVEHGGNQNSIDFALEELDELESMLEEAA